MKQINRINQYLLKYYPLVWNTRIVWMLLAGFIFHLFFFGMGYLNLVNPISLHDYSVTDNFFNSGIIMLSILLSILLILGWMIFMFKNNSFKSFYPTSRSQLFGHFVFYFIIIFFNISFYFSHFYGMKLAVHLNHIENVVDDDIALANRVFPFFSHHLDKYEIDRKKYPSYFLDLYCETNVGLINLEKPYLKFLEEKYQYYTLKKDVFKKGKGRAEEGYVFYEEVNDSTFAFFYKDTVVDISSKIQTTYPSYYNFSNLFYRPNKRNYGRYYTTRYDGYEAGSGYWKDTLISNFILQHNLLLEKNDATEIKSLLDDFMNMTERYQISTNLTSEIWFPLVYTDSFLLRNLIWNEAPDAFNYYTRRYDDWDRKSGSQNDAYDENGNRIKPVRDEFVEKIQTNYYLESKSLRNTFFNISEVKRTNPFEDAIHFFMWFSFFLTSLIFVFRISGARSLIFSILSFGVLTVLIVLFGISYNYNSISSLSPDTFVAILIWILGTVVLVIPIFYLKRVHKMVSSICVNFSLTFFALYLFLILFLISTYQNYTCDLRNKTIQGRHVQVCNEGDILRYLDSGWSFVLFILAFVFIYIYTEVIKRWRALPDKK